MTTQEQIDWLANEMHNYCRASDAIMDCIVAIEEDLAQKERFIAELQQIVDKFGKDRDKATAWHQYFMENPEKVFTGAEVVAIMHKNALDD